MSTQEQTGEKSPKNVRTEVEHIFNIQTRETAARFSLAREGFAENLVQDLIFSVKNGHLLSTKKAEEVKRILAVDSSLVSDDIYKKLENENIPQLTLIKTPAKNSVKVFNIEWGMKPLYLDALNRGVSTETYISDSEIYYKVGQLYRNAWRATGRMLLDPGVSNDYPAKHIAMNGFSDSQGETSDLLFLCPPYLETPAVDHSEALEIFTQSMENIMIERSGTNFRSNTTEDITRDIVRIAIEGFNGA